MLPLPYCTYYIGISSFVLLFLINVLKLLSKKTASFTFVPTMYGLFSSVPASRRFYNSFYFLPFNFFFPLFAQGLKVSQNEWIGPWLSSFLGLSWACTQPYMCVQHFRSPEICLVLQDFLLNSWSGSCLSWNHSLRQQLDTASRLLLFLWCPRG